MSYESNRVIIIKFMYANYIQSDPHKNLHRAITPVIIEINEFCFFSYFGKGTIEFRTVCNQCDQQLKYFRFHLE